MDYIITGGAGFIGSHLAKTLLQQDDTVDVIDNLSTGDPGSAFINVGSGTTTSILALANLFIKHSKKNLSPNISKGTGGKREDKSG